MTVVEPNLAWDDPAWQEPSDNTWQRGLRRQQAWWRQERLGIPAGPRTANDGRLVMSMLPTSVDFTPNLMSDDAARAARAAIDSIEEENRPGFIQEDRLKRNLLSSQPLCFNLFGHLAADPDALLPWVQSLRPGATSIAHVRLEWAPRHGTIGGSAFDAFIEYTTDTNHRGFVGIECKYAENLANAQRNSARTEYVAATKDGPWKAGAELALDKSGLRQFWYNQLLTQIVASSGEHGEGLGVVVACHADQPARRAVDTVADQLDDPGGIRFSSLEDVAGSISGHEEWCQSFVERYLDFTPVQHLLSPSDPRRS